MVVDSAMDRRKRKSDRPNIRPSDKVKKCLFGKADKHEKEEELRTVEQENLSDLEKMKVKYGYDFAEDKHLKLENTPYIVAKVIEASCEKDSNVEISSASVESVEERTADQSSTTTPNKKCLDEIHSDSKSSNSNSVNGTINETNQNGERNCIRKPDKVFVESDGQS